MAKHGFRREDDRSASWCPPWLPVIVIIDSLPGLMSALALLKAFRMMDPTGFALYLVAALVLAITPGPGLFYVGARTLAGGRSEGIASSFGTGLGGMAHVLAGSLGISALVLASANLFTVLKFAGAAYLVWLGLRTIWAARKRASIVEGMDHPPLGPWSAFREGVLVEALNPKTAAFFLAFIPQFIDPATSSVALQFVVLGFIAVALNTLADLAVAFAAGHVRSAVSMRPRLISRLQQVSGAGMIVLGLGLSLARRPAN